MPRKNVVAVTPGGDITPEMIAGEFFWYSIPDQMLSLATVRRLFKEHDLDVDRLPKARRAEHVAQEACRKVEGTENNGHRIEIRAEQVLRTNTELVYQITRHVQDQKNRVIEHPKALRVVFDMRKATLKFEPLESTTRSEVKNLIDAITEHYDNNASKIPGHKLRTILRHYVEAVGAENMRGQSGGVYFFAKNNPQPDGTVIDGQEFLSKIQAVLDGLYGDAPEFHRVPCVNDEGQRAYLKRKFIENCSEDLETYRERLLELVRDKDKRARGFRQDMIVNLVEARKAIDARRAKFADILQDELQELNRNMTLADKALAKFMQEAEVAA